jgi:hypothetical protein
MKGAWGTVKLYVPTIPAASVAFVFFAVKTFVPVLAPPAPFPPGPPLEPPFAVQFGDAEVEIWLLTKFYLFLFRLFFLLS